MLDDYQAIVEGRRKARFLLTKSIPISAGGLTSLTEDELWQLHDEGLGKFRKFKAEVVKESKPAKVSLFDLKLELTSRILANCHFCERRCGKNRKAGELGYCKVANESRYASEFLHLGEEPELVPSHTIFFSGCTFSCVYCQNFDIATSPNLGREVLPEVLAKLIVERHQQGSKNVNFVGGNPDPNLLTIFQIIKEVDINIPMVWNSNMYTSLESMKLLEGVIDLYLGDFRYGNDVCAKKYSDVDNYFAVVARNFQEADRQADVILRHLVLPGHIDCCTKPIVEWVKENIPQVYFNLMFQYHPCFRASLYPELNRLLDSKEREEALEIVREASLVFQ